ncbi:SMI1/KNR4 family protein [Frankia sp. Cj3]|uniref:SMI1/KNR4 family protein n=1 Tax=Frankia sp. Cj3 TaxID=2880976 RepID=UPI00351D3A1E
MTCSTVFAGCGPDSPPPPKVPQPAMNTSVVATVNSRRIEPPYLLASAWKRLASGQFQPSMRAAEKESDGVLQGTVPPSRRPGMIPGGRYAFQIVHAGSPMLRIRYRDGILAGPHGFPDWIPYARAVVQLPPCSPDLGVDEARVVDVLTANNTMAAGGDALWADVCPGATPAGWTWAHLPAVWSRTRRIALVPVELHGAYRHLGGVSTGSADRARRGLAMHGGTPPRIRLTHRLSGEVLERLEERLGYGLPAGYRSFLLRTNGGCPAWPAVHPGFGFVADQPFFGMARQDWLQDLAYANAWFGDRLTSESPSGNAKRSRA